jgi:8-oxo-dGTP pyrophosphatase MutT (NUDIX family)
MQPGQHRETARVLLTDPNNRVFLLKTHFDPEVQLPPRWITPGGGIDPGESVRKAAITRVVTN